MTVNLTKDASLLRYAQVRTDADNGALYDLFSWEQVNRPLWFDDASYIAYQSDDGPRGYWKHELNFRPDERGAIVATWVDFEYDADDESLSRDDRLVLEAQWVAQAAKDEAERQAWLATLEEVPF